jgi:pimeloyl-ACP methyl ester carboxylesterase
MNEFMPSIAGEEGMPRWWRRCVLSSASPGAILALRRMNIGIDARHTLPAISVPTLVLHRVEDQDYLLAEGHYLASRIRGAELIELPGRDHGWWVHSMEIADEIERFLVDIWDRGRVEPRRDGSDPRHCAVHRHRTFDRDARRGR